MAYTKGLRGGAPGRQGMIAWWGGGRYLSCMSNPQQSRRQRRLGRIYDSAPAYFLTICTEGRARVLDNDVVMNRVCGFAAESMGRYGVFVDCEFRWQAGFFDHVLRSDESRSEKWEYIRMNPVRAGLVEEADDWPYAQQFNPLDGSEL